MPGFVDPNEQESRQSLYRDLLYHLNTTIWGSPSIQDNLNPAKTLGETFSELTYRPSEEELRSNSIEFGPEGKALPKTIAGKLSRFTRKLALDPLYSGANALDRAYKCQASMQDSAESALTALSGGMFGSGGSAVANAGPGWHSRTLDWLAGRLGKAPKQATKESWLAKAKQAGLPTEEREVIDWSLRDYGPKDRMGADNLSYIAEKMHNLPTQGIEAIELSAERADRYQRALEKIDEARTDLLTGYKSKRRQLHMERYESNHPGSDLYKTLRNKSDDLSEKITEFRPRWTIHNLDEVTSPREILYKAKGSRYKNPDIETHYGDIGEGLQWHQREGKLKLPEGESTHLSEQQSDLMSEWVKGTSKKGVTYYTDPQAGRIEINPRDVHIRQADDGEYYLDVGGNYHGYFRTENEALIDLNRRISQATKETPVPKPTLHENWYK